MYFTKENQNLSKLIYKHQPTLMGDTYLDPLIVPMVTALSSNCAMMSSAPPII